MMEWNDAIQNPPDEYVSVLIHIVDADPFPDVREGFRVGDKYYSPALMEHVNVDLWMEMPIPPKKRVE